eukprot:COSAG02_NODE_772_length_17359_cov_74.661587_6_plen_1389_part_00
MPRLPSLKAGFSTQAGGGFDSGNGGAARYRPVRPDIVAITNGPGVAQVLMGGWSTWWMMVGDKPVVSIAGRSGAGAYSSPGVVDGVGVGGSGRLAVVHNSGATKWLHDFLCDAWLAPGTATWTCTDAEFGQVNLTTYPLQENQTGIVLQCTTSEQQAALVWAVTLTGKNDTVALTNLSGVPTARLAPTANITGAGQQRWGSTTELYAAALPAGSAFVADTGSCAGTIVPSPNAGAANPCALLKGSLSCKKSGVCTGHLVVSWGYSRVPNESAVREALARLEQQREMFDPHYYSRLVNGTNEFPSWFASWIGRSLKPAAAHSALLQPGAVEAAVRASRQWNRQHRPLQLHSPDADFDVALAHCSGEMMYQYEHPGFLHGVNDAKYGKISIGTLGATAAGYHKQVESTLYFIAGTQDPLTHRQRYWSPGLAIANWAEEQDFYFVEQVLFHAQWSNTSGSGIRFLQRMWPAVMRAVEQGLRASDPDNDGIFTGYYEYWDNDTRDRGGKCVEQTALALSALRAASKIAEYTGNTITAAKFDALANRTAALMTSTFWLQSIGAWGSAEWNGDIRLRPEAQENFAVVSRGLGDYVTAQQAYLSSRYLREVLFIGDRDNVTLEVINDWWPIVWSHQYVANGDAAQSCLAACRAGDVDGYHPMLKSVTVGQYFSTDATMGNEQFNDGFATGMKDLVELQPAMLEAVVRGYYGVDLRLMENLIVISPNLPSEWVKSGKSVSISTPDLQYNFTQANGKLVVELKTWTARTIQMDLPIRAAVNSVSTTLSLFAQTVPSSFTPVSGLVNRARVRVRSAAATAYMKAEVLFGSEARIVGNRTVVLGTPTTFSVQHATVVKVHDPQGVVEQARITRNEIKITPTVDRWQLQDGLEGWPLPATIFVELVATTSSAAPDGSATKITWLEPLDLMVAPPWRIMTIAVAAKGQVPLQFGTLGCPDGTAPPCVVLPRLGDILGPAPPAGTLRMVDCKATDALNFTAPELAEGNSAVIRVVGTQSCLSVAGGGPSNTQTVLLQNCRAAPRWYWRSGYHSNEGGHLCLATDTQVCLDRAHHIHDFTTLDAYTFVPTAVEKYHDENWSLNATGQLVSRCIEPSCAAKQCVGGSLPPETPPVPPSVASNVSFSLALCNDGQTAIAGTATVSIAAFGFSTAVVVNMPPNSVQQIGVYITEEQHLSRISPGTTRVMVSLAGRTQVADAVRWSSLPGINASTTIHALDLSQAFNFDAEELYSAKSMASRWRLDYTGIGIGIEAQLRYNNTARIAAQRPGHPIAVDNTTPYRGYYLDSPPITNLGYGNLPEHLCHSGLGQGHCNNNPGLNTGLVPNGTLKDAMSCNVWRSTAGQWLLPRFSSWSDLHPGGLSPSLLFKTGRKGERNIVALVASQV